MKKQRATVLTLCFLLGYACNHALAARSQEAQAQAAPDPATLDKILAPVALYPDALIAQILFCSTDPNKVRELNSFIQKNKKLKGTELQEAAEKAGFAPSYCAIVIFPQVVKTMNDSSGWTRQLGQAFTADKKAVFDSVQRLRSQAVEVGNLKTTPQQEVQTVDQGGQQVIVIQPSNPQVVYVPQYNPETVYTTQAPPATQTVVIHEDDDDGEAAAAGLIGFGVGVALGASMNSSYYYGPYGWGGYGMHYGGYYGADWDDVADYREDRREDFYDHREDMRENAPERSAEQQAQRQQAAADRQTSRQQSASERQANRQSGTTQSASERQASRQSGTTPSAADRQASRQSSGATSSIQNRSAGSSSRGTGASSLPSGYSSRGYGSGGYGQSSSQASRQRSSSGAGAFSGYERGSSTRASSSRGRSSMGGGGRGGGRRR